ncbi:MAG: hypothetical protein CL816_00395 [Coxiellaceae bacterium]|nr:hypothetical protein [Coxiellaceae bacterium]|tara:strand:- start:5182 stop:5805 length:624 start_codon:yes stop_codon:yes gene_type:complete
MLFNKKIITTIAIFSVLFLSDSFANDSQNYQVSPEQLALAEQNGYFAGLDLGYSLIDWDSFLLGDTISSGSNGGFTANIKGGYRWNHRLAAESGLQYLPSVDYTSKGKDYSITQWFSYLALELDASIFPKTATFIQAGLGYHYIDDEQTGSDNTIKPYYAAGIAYTVTPKWVADIKCSFYSTDEEIDGHNGYVPTINTFTLGVKYLF